ncbi:adenine deaminase [Lacibacter luteus]|uniref:Adenine deaminase n=1 Tax=Lacibacter luteus TaxID=2508719 RepID=A0A4Q1CH73_9BACT|nr:adenine deaminase [Lacibacter luteus]RXK59256.1 adenine deaminase [Lacibacter luteus]
MNAYSIHGNIVNLFNRTVFAGTVTVQNGQVKEVLQSSPVEDSGLPYILPGFIDSHVHIESSMLVPSEFAKLAVVHGTVATVSDPHEIANVCGMAGVEYMIENGKTVPFKFNFGAPSCVPATTFETAGAVLNAADVKTLLQKDEIKYLSEMMNFPGVLHADAEVMEKIKAAHALGKPVDGHAPGLRGEDAKKYIEAGISTDHECFTKEEAFDKLKHGMKIIIREGSAAKNFEALYSLIDEYPDMILLCSDDKHPDSLVEGHINQLCARAVAKGLDVFNVLKAACITPVLHYKLDVGLLRAGDAADFIVVNNLKEFKAEKTFINGELVAENGKSLIESNPSAPINNFNCDVKPVAEFEFHLNRFGKADEENIEQVYVIEAMDGQLITNKRIEPITSFTVTNDIIQANTEKDLLYMVVVNRYSNAPVAKSFVKNFGLKQGAIASSVAHDSHNIIAVGVDAESLSRAVNLVIEAKGGVSVVGKEAVQVLPLPVAGLMSTDDGYKVAEAYSAIDAAAKKLGSTLAAPFMTLSFMGLLVIPHLKLSDIGLFDGDGFKLI